MNNCSAGGPVKSIRFFVHGFMLKSAPSLKGCASLRLQDPLHERLCILWQEKLEGKKGE